MRGGAFRTWEMACLGKHGHYEISGEPDPVLRAMGGDLLKFCRSVRVAGQLIAASLENPSARGNWRFSLPWHEVA